METSSQSNLKRTQSKLYFIAFEAAQRNKAKNAKISTRVWQPPGHPLPAQVDGMIEKGHAGTRGHSLT